MKTILLTLVLIANLLVTGLMSQTFPWKSRNQPVYENVLVKTEFITITELTFMTPLGSLHVVITTYNDYCSQCKGKTVLKITGPCFPFNVSLDGIWKGTTDYELTIDGLCGDNWYTICVTDLLGESYSENIDILNTSGPTAKVVQTPVTCLCSTGSLEVFPSGSSGYSYLWSNGETTKKVDNLSAGKTLSVTVTDCNGCTVCVSGTVGNDKTNIDVLLKKVTNEKCGNGKGMVELVPLSGAKYNWSKGGSTTYYADGLHEGYISVTVTDINGCTGSITEYVDDESTLINVSVKREVPEKCGDGTGWAEVSCASNVTYRWSNGQIGNVASGLHEGKYTVTATDQNGCKGTAVATIGNDKKPIYILVEREGCDSVKEYGRTFYSDYFKKETIDCSPGCDTIFDWKITVHKSTFDHVNIYTCDQSICKDSTVAVNNPCGCGCKNYIIYHIIYRYEKKIYDAPIEWTCDPTQVKETFVTFHGTKICDSIIRYRTLLDPLCKTYYFCFDPCSCEPVNVIWAPDGIDREWDNGSHSLKREIPNVVGTYMFSVLVQHWDLSVHVYYYTVIVREPIYQVKIRTPNDITKACDSIPMTAVVLGYYTSGQWYIQRGNIFVAIPGANKLNYTATETADYSFVATGPCGSVEARIWIDIDKCGQNTSIIRPYPNPFHDYLTIEVIGTPDIIELLDAQGKLLAEYPALKTQTIDMKAYPLGIYFLRFKGGGQNTVKIMKV